jgi:hypothetical protein
MSDIGLGESIHTNNQLEEFATFQDNQGTRKAYLDETAELAGIRMRYSAAKLQMLSKNELHLMHPL